MKEDTFSWVVERTFLEYTDDDPEDDEPETPCQRAFTDSVLLSALDEDASADEADEKTSRRSSLLADLASCPAAPLTPIARSGGQGRSEAEAAPPTPPASDAPRGPLEAPAMLGVKRLFLPGPSIVKPPPIAPPLLPPQLPAPLLRQPWPAPPAPPAASLAAPASPRPGRPCPGHGRRSEHRTTSPGPRGQVVRSRSSSSSASSAGDTWRTTAMLRNLPKELTRTKLLSLLDEEGFWGRHDLVYLPVDFSSGAAMGHVFINMVSSEDAQTIWGAFHGFSRWPGGLPSPHPGACARGAVEWSVPHQGLYAHVERYRDSPVMHPQVPDEWKPILLSHGRRLEFPSPCKSLKAPKFGIHGRAGPGGAGRPDQPVGPTGQSAAGRLMDGSADGGVRGWPAFHEAP